MQEINLSDLGKIFREKLKALGSSLSRYNYIYGIPKNGLIVALLEAPRYPTLLLTLKELKQALLAGHRVLIIDDVRDSGRTEQKLKEYLGEGALKNASFLYIVDKKEGGNDNWIRFPWEDWEETMKDPQDDELRKQQKNE